MVDFYVGTKNVKTVFISCDSLSEEIFRPYIKLLNLHKQNYLIGPLICIASPLRNVFICCLTRKNQVLQRGYGSTRIN